VSNKIIVILLILSILLSVGSIVITSSLNLSSVKEVFSNQKAHAVPDASFGKVGLDIASLAGGAG
jgi:flagellar basal body-associated protein FliL